MLLSASKTINSNSSQSEPAVNLSLLHSHSRALCGLKNIERNEEAFILALIKVLTQSSIKKKKEGKNKGCTMHQVQMKATLTFWMVLFGVAVKSELTNHIKQTSSSHDAH